MQLSEIESGKSTLSSQTETEPSSPLTPEPTDEQLRATLAAARARTDSGSGTGLVSVPVPNLSPNGICIRCRKVLPEDRLIQCSDCDSSIADALAKREAIRTAEALANRFRHSALPLDYRTRKRTLDHLPEIALQAVAICRLLGKDVRGLYAWGPAGSFKTSLAAAYLADQIAAGFSGRYVFVPDLMSDVHASYRSNDVESREAIVARCVWTRLLVLDDLGKEKASEHAAGVIFEILDGRYRNALPGDWTIVTSNFDLDALCDRFPGDEVADPIRRRLSELTVSVPMERSLS